MSAAGLINRPMPGVLDRRIWLIVAVITLLHLFSAAVVKYGFPSFAPRKSEITIELSASQPRGEGGTGARVAPAPTPTTQPKKSAERDELATKRPVDTPKPPTTAAPTTSSASAGVESAPTVDADYKAAYLNNPKPPYPPVAFQMRIEGTVNVKALVLPDGSCGEVLLGRSSGNDLLDRSALNTVAQWKFTPAKSQGKDIAQWVSIPINFTIKRR